MPEPIRPWAVRVPVRFRATFSPPDDIEDYMITWDFGDGTEPATVYRTAPTQVTGQLITATVTHHYRDPTGSPFIAQVTIRGTGEGGIVEGEDTLTVSVSEVPAIEVFAGEGRFVDQNTEVEFSGSFTRPKGLTNVRYEWDFGDGSTPAEGDLPEGVTRATATHVYPDHRREPYVARFTVTADSEVGEVEASGEDQHLRHGAGRLRGGRLRSRRQLQDRGQGLHRVPARAVRGRHVGCHLQPILGSHRGSRLVPAAQTQASRR